jgi:uncharacterized OB-fold protein
VPSEAYVEYASYMKRYGHVKGGGTVQETRCDKCGQLLEPHGVVTPDTTAETTVPWYSETDG